MTPEKAMPLVRLSGRGGKSGGGDVRMPSEDKNTLRSKAYARFIDLLSEGPVEGFCTSTGITIRDATLMVGGDATFVVARVKSTKIETGGNSVFVNTIPVKHGLTKGNKFRIAGANNKTYNTEWVVDHVYDEVSFRFLRAAAPKLEGNVVTVQKSALYIDIIAGEIVFPVATFPRESDNVISRYMTDGRSNSLVSDSSGYPFLDGANPILCVIEGDGTGAEIRVKVYPTNETQARETRLPCNQADHGFKIGDQIRFDERGWTKAVPDNQGLIHGGELREVTDVINEYSFEAKLATFPDGKVRGIQLYSGGSKYTYATITIPSAVMQSVYFDDEPVLDSQSLKPNFKDIRFSYRLGDEDQRSLPGFEQIEQIIDINENKELKFGPLNSYKVSIESQNYDRLMIDIQLLRGLYIVDYGNGGDVKAVVNPADIPFDARNPNPTKHFVHFKIEQRGRKTSQSSWAGDEDGWIPFGDGEYVLTGKTMAPYSRTIEAELTKPDPYETYNWEIRITRESMDDEDANKIFSEWRWTTAFKVAQITAITNKKLTYPFCAIAGIEINAEQFGNVPLRSYLYKGILVPVPTNYFPPYSVKEVQLPSGYVIREIRKFAAYNRGKNGLPVVDGDGNNIEQIWDGTFYDCWTNNPSWIAYWACTDTRAAFGKFLKQSNKWEHYKIARYNDGLVKTGFLNGTYSTDEARFTFGTYIQAKEEAWKFLADLASNFSAFYYYGQGMAIPVQDRPRVDSLGHVSPRMQFTKSDVENGIFTYKGTQRRVRHSVSLVKYNNPDNQFKLDPVYYEDAEAIKRYGVNPLDKTAFGCISRGQARRLAKKLIRMEISNTDTVSFVTTIKASILRLGDLISIYDPVKSSLPYAGRILAIVTDPVSKKAVLHLDRWFELIKDSVAADFSIVVSIPQKEMQQQELVNASDIDKLSQPQISDQLRIYAFGESAKRRTITLWEGAPEGLVVGAVWGLVHTVVKPQYFVTLGVSEQTKHKFTVTALEYHNALFGEVDFDIPYTEEAINPDLDGWKLPFPVENLTVSYTTKMEQDIQVYTLNVSWSRPSKGFAVEYEVYWQKGLANYLLLTTTPNTHADTRLPEPSHYCVRVYTIGLQKRRSSYVEMCVTVGVLSGDNAEIISGLELKNKGNVHVFDTGDIELDWRVNWSDATTEMQTALAPALPPGVRSYVVKAIRPDDSLVLSSYDVKDSFLLLTVNQNKAFLGGPYRDLIFRVLAQTNDGGLSAFTEIRVKNFSPPAPITPMTENSSYEIKATEIGTVLVRFKDNRAGTDGIVAGENDGEIVIFQSPAATFDPSVIGRVINLENRGPFQIRTFVDHITLGIAPITDRTFPQAGVGIDYFIDDIKDFAGMRVWASTVPGFAPSSVNLMREVSSRSCEFEVAIGVPTYIRFAEFDLLSNNVLDCNISGEIVVTGFKRAGLTVFDFLHMT